MLLTSVDGTRIYYGSRLWHYLWVENGFGAQRRGGRTTETNNLEYGVAELDPVLETDDMGTTGSR